MPSYSPFSRALCQIRAACPPLIFIPVFIIGQLACFYCTKGVLYWGIGLLVLGYVISVSSFSAGIRIAALFSGFLSAFSLQTTYQGPHLGAQSYLVKVVDRPRYRKAGEVQFIAELLGSLKGDDHGTLQLSSYSAKPRALCRAVQLPGRNSLHINEGRVLVMRASFDALEPELNPFSWTNYMARRNVFHSCKAKLLSAPVLEASPTLPRYLQTEYINHVRQVLGKGEKSGLLLALSIGLRDSISQKTEDSFRSLGLSHLLVVSGFQVSMVYVSLFWLTSALLSLIPFSFVALPMLAGALSLSMALLFVALCGFESSSIRALCALCILTYAKLSERGAGFLIVVASSLIILSAFSPFLYCEPGTQLSYAALLGIWLASKLQGSANTICSMLGVSICASLCTSLVGYFWFGSLPLLGLLLNPVFSLAMSFLGCHAVLLGVLVKAIGLDSHGMILRLVSSVLTLFVQAAEFFSQISANVGSFWQAVMFVICALTTVCLFYYRARFALLERNLFS